MRLLAINPNTTAEVTARVVAAGKHSHQAASRSLALRVVSGRATSLRAVRGNCRHATLDAYAENGAGVDGVLLACFGDPGLHALRELAPCPVLGLAEAPASRQPRAGGAFPSSPAAKDGPLCSRNSWR